MANDRDAVPIHQIRRLYEGGVTGGLSDGELLKRFLARDGQAAERAFTALVERHGPMVLRVARSALRERHDADDAFQATFLILARKAGSLDARYPLGPWLHGVAYRVAVCARAAAHRRRDKERRAAEAAPVSTVDRPPDDLAATLDAEIAHLPDRYRKVVVLCLVQGLTQEQAADRLGWPAGTVRSRLARGRERLRGRLVRRGLAPSAVVAGACAAPETFAATLVESTTRVVLSGLPGFTAGESLVSAAVAGLASQVSRDLVMSRIQIAAMLCLTACAGAAGVQVFAQQNRPVPPQAQTFNPFQPKQAKPAEGGEATEFVGIKFTPPQPKPPQTRWRYHSVRLVYESQLADKANEEAEKGWEVVEIVPVIRGINGNIQDTQYTILFRRPADAND